MYPAGELKRMSFRIVGILLFVLIDITAFGQTLTTKANYNWHFGSNSEAIRFNRVDQTPTRITKSSLGTGGSATVSLSYNGELLFYTDGTTIFDRNNSPMPNGTGLLGSPTENQGVVVAQVPGNPNQFFVVTRDAGTLRYSVVDMTLFGNSPFPNPPLGDVTSKNLPVGPITRSEGMVFVPNSNGTDLWLISHQAGVNRYTVTQFTAAGPGTATDFIGLGRIEQTANMVWHPGTNRIAVVPNETRRDAEIFDFDPALGALIFNQTVLNSGVNTTTDFIYDSEWSTSGRYLYLSITGEGATAADVVQFDLTNSLASLTSILPATISKSYGLQMAPDSSIYHLYQASSGGPFRVGRIADTDSIASLVQYTSQVFNGINFSSRQFTATPPPANSNLTISFVNDGSCSNSPIAFYPTVSPAADSLLWDFGDGNSSNQWSPVHTYTAGGSVTASVTAFLNGQTATASLPLSITDFTTQINLVSDTTACSCELPFPRADPPPAPCATLFQVNAQVTGGGTLQWYGPSGLLIGATSSSLAPDSAGYYYVVATQGSCSTYAGVNIREYGVEDQRANIWYFGNLAGIDFNPLPENPAVAITNPRMNAPEGTSTISDRNGQVIFYTDGDSVWNRLNQPLAGGIGGSLNSTQSAIIMPVQGDETLYYIFTTEEIQGTNTYNLKYSLFDLKQNNGLGAVVQQNITLFSRSTERITANANWLIAHEYGNNSFRAYRVSTSGISAPVISSIGSDHSLSIAANGEGYMKLSGRSKIAVAFSNPGVSNVLEIFDFVDSSGVVTNFKTANTQQTAGKLYGVEFSPGGNKLFTTLQTGGTTRIVEFALDSLGNPFLKKPGLAPVSGLLGAIQTGPDGQVYVAVEGSNTLGIIQVNEDTTATSTYNSNGFVLAAGSNSRLGLPNFVQTIIDPVQGPGASISGFCLGSPTEFSASGTDNIDEFQWFFGDGQSANTPTVSHTYAAAGTYLTSVRIFNRCGYDTLISQTITINTPPAPPTFLAPGQIPVLCNGPVPLEATPLSNPNLATLSFVWSDGSTNRTLVASVQNLYIVTINSTNGCSSSGAIVIADNRPVVNLGPDLTLCQNTALFPLDAQNNAPGTTYVWELNSAIIGNSRTQSVDTSLPTAANVPNVYRVTVVDGFGCSVTDQVAYTIVQSPVFTATPSNPTSCLSASGSIQINLQAPLNTLYTVDVTTLPSQFDLPPGAMALINNLVAGAYGVTVTDQISGCQITTAVTLNDIAFTATATQVGVCDPTLLLNVTSTPAYAATINYRIINTGNGQVVGSASQPTGNFLTTAVPSGSTYSVEVTQVATGCVSSTPPLLLTQGPTLTVTIDDLQICNGTVTAIASGATSFDWSASPTGSLQNTTGPLVNVNPGSWQLSVSADDGPGGLCPGIATLPVTAGTPLTPVIIQGDACNDLVPVTTTPASNSFIYRWSRNSVNDPALGGSEVFAAIANDGQTYQVSVQNPTTGCSYNSNIITVNIEGTFTVDLETSVPCEGSPFTLTANPIRPAGNFAWKFNGGVIAGQNSITLQDTRAGTYTVTAFSSICSAEDDLRITLVPLTPGDLRDLGRICPDPSNPDPLTRELTLTPGTFAGYDWFKDGVSLGITTPTLTVSEQGIFSVDLTDPFGCVTTDVTDVIVDCEPVVTGPNAFRPGSSVVVGGENINQNFRLFTFFIDDNPFEVAVFNRWGEMVFTSSDRNFRWNGGYNNSGPLLPAGTYSYLVRFRSSYRPEEGIKEIRGGVVLVR